MSRFVPNTAPVGQDYCLDPVAIQVPLLFINNGTDCFWYHDALDSSTADRLAFALTHGQNVDTHRIDLQLILPSAHDVHTTTPDLHNLNAVPVRVTLCAESDGDQP